MRVGCDGTDPPCKEAGEKSRSGEMGTNHWRSFGGFSRPKDRNIRRSMVWRSTTLEELYGAIHRFADQPAATGFASIAARFAPPTARRDHQRPVAAGNAAAVDPRARGVLPRFAQHCRGGL